MNDDLDLENLDELQDDELELEDDTDLEQEEDEPERQGNLSKALQQERREKRELRSELDQLKADQKRLQSLLERTGQPQRQQVDPEQHRSQLQSFMLERPDEYTAYIRQDLQQSVKSQIAPLLVTQTERVVAKNADHRAAYEDEGIRDAIDAYVMNEIQTGGIENMQDLQEVVPKVMDWILKIRSPQAQGGNRVEPNKQKMTSIAQKGASGSRKSAEQRAKDLENLARTNPRKYTEEMKKPENRAAINEVVFRKRGPA